MASHVQAHYDSLHSAIFKVALVTRSLIANWENGAIGPAAQGHAVVDSVPAIALLMWSPLPEAGHATRWQPWQEHLATLAAAMESFRSVGGLIGNLGTTARPPVEVGSSSAYVKSNGCQQQTHLSAAWVSPCHAMGRTTMIALGHRKQSGPVLSWHATTDQHHCLATGQIGQLGGPAHVKVFKSVIEALNSERGTEASYVKVQRSRPRGVNPTV